MFSIQIASTGPSKIIHFLSGVNDSAQSRTLIANTPSDHSPVSALRVPYSCVYWIDLGLM